MNSKVKYSKELLEPIVKESISVAEVIRKIGLKQSGSIHSHLTRRIKLYNLDTSHFLGSRANSGSRHVGGHVKLLPKNVLVYDRLNGRRDHASTLRRALLESNIEEKCEQCSLPSEWNGKPIVLHIDHRDGNGVNNVIENLRFLCPNCHSQTDNYGAKNISKK